MAIARFYGFVLDCPDPTALATFYSGLLGWEADTSEDDWAYVISTDGNRISFQKVDDYTPPDWPNQSVPQQVHLDVMVDSFEEAEGPTLALGATKHDHQPGDDFRVFLDPAGHPFCLCVSS